jgi:LmbE family N-acetylglucosaminyl deacetylase
MSFRAAALLVAVATAAHGGGGILVVAPHPDDEVLSAGGIMEAALNGGTAVDVAVITNGDYYGTSYGLTRQGESVAALATLGMPEERVMFLGYPDAGLLAIWNDAPSPTDAWLSPRNGRSATYGSRGFGGGDVHTVMTGAPGAYNRPTLVGDVGLVLARTRPAAIYTTGPFDHHPDHRGTFYAVRDAARALAATDPAFRPTVYTTIVHDPVGYPYDDFWPAHSGRTVTLDAGNEAGWPNPAAGSGVSRRFDPSVPFVMPPSLPRTILGWAARDVWPVPRAMADPVFDTNRKVAVLRQYVTQVGDVLWSHVKADEFFWSAPLRTSVFTANVARAATVTASAESPGQGAAGAVDGVVDGAPGRPEAEWAASPGQSAATLSLVWPRALDVDRVVLYDRPGLADQVTVTRLVLDDGTSVPVGALANDGRGDDVVLAAVHRISRLTVVLEARGTAGLAEVEVFGRLVQPPCATDAECDDGDPCTVDACDAGRCAPQPAADGAGCGDDDACNGVERCRAGACERLPPPDCADGDPCTTDVCLAGGQCGHTFTCRPRPARGRGGCRLAFTGTPRRPCVDGDPACDDDGATDGVCRFDVVACVTAAPSLGRCRLRGPLGGMIVGGHSEELAGVIARLGARLPSNGPSCAGPTAVTVTAGRRRRLAAELIGTDGRAQRAHLSLRCRRAPRGVVRRPPAPLLP